LAITHRRIARPQPAGLGHAHGLRGQRGTIVQPHTAPERSQRGGVDLAFDLRQIRLGLLVARIGEPMRERAVIGEQQQPFAVAVQPSSRIDVRLRDVAGQGLARVGAAELAQYAVRFVDCDQHRMAPMAAAAIA
jgi:hypothetical protein